MLKHENPVSKLRKWNKQSQDNESKIKITCKTRIEGGKHTCDGEKRSFSNCGW